MFSFPAVAPRGGTPAQAEVLTPFRASACALSDHHRFHEVIK